MLLNIQFYSLSFFRIIQNLIASERYGSNLILITHYTQVHNTINLTHM